MVLRGRGQIDGSCPGDIQGGMSSESGGMVFSGGSGGGGEEFFSIAIFLRRFSLIIKACVSRSRGLAMPPPSPPEFFSMGSKGPGG